MSELKAYSYIQLIGYDTPREKKAFYLKSEADKVIAELKEKNRRLERALWLARAERAEAEARGWYHSTGYCVKYDGGHTIKGALFGKGLLRLPDEWMKIWIKVERKCRAKAEFYL